MKMRDGAEITGIFDIFYFREKPYVRLGAFLAPISPAPPMVPLSRRGRVPRVILSR